MNNSHTTPIFATVLTLIAANAEFMAGHTLNALGIVVGAIALGLAARWLAFRLKQ